MLVFCLQFFYYQAYKPVNLFFRFFLLQKKRQQEEKAKQVYNSGYEVFGKKKGKKKREKKTMAFTKMHHDASLQL